MFNLIKIIFKTLLEKNPLYPELFWNYEEYHMLPHVNPMYEIRYKLISSWIKPRTLILDVGCGEGYFIERLTKEKEASYMVLTFHMQPLGGSEIRDLKFMFVMLIWRD